jgi:collagen type IV alpha-3-binding protein
MLSLNSTASLSITSTGSHKRGLGLKEKLAEMETFKDILCRQVETLQTYFDACANSSTKGFEPYHKEFEKKLAEDEENEDELNSDESKIINNKNILVNQMVKNLNKAILEDHGGMSLDFKGEAFTFKATTTGILHDLSLCIELMQQREEFWKKKFDKVLNFLRNFFFVNILN